MNLDGGFAGEGRLASQHLEHERAEREQIGAWIRQARGPLLGRHVTRRPRGEVGARHRLLQLGGAARRASEAEIHQFHAVARDEDVRRLEIAMDDAALMECVEGAQDRQGDSGCLGQGDGPLREPHVERLAVEQLHCDEDPLANLVYLVDLADGGMVHARRGPRLAPQSGPRVVAARDV